MAIDRSLVSGSMGMLILRLLSEKDMYGYEMIDTLKKRSENVFELKAVWKKNSSSIPMSRKCWGKSGNIIRLLRKAESIWSRKKRSGRNTQKQSAMFWRWRCKHENG